MPDNESHRAAVRTALRKFMEARYLDSARLANEMEAKRGDFAQDVISAKRLISHDTIDRFLNEHSTGNYIAKRLFGIIKRFLLLEKFLLESDNVAKSENIDRRSANVEAVISTIPPDLLSKDVISASEFFESVRRFFSVTMEDQKNCEPIVGTYVFYTDSEDYDESTERYVVIGAVKFAREADGSLCVTEQQESKVEVFDAKSPKQGAPATNDLIERWNGVFFFQSGRIVAIMRENIDSLAKFYILLPNKYSGDTKTVTDMRGHMVKIGKSNSAWIKKVRLVRDDMAFGKCQVVHHTRLSRAILDLI